MSVAAAVACSDPLFNPLPEPLPPPQGGGDPPEFLDIRVSPDPAAAGALLTNQFTANQPVPGRPEVTVDDNAATFVSETSRDYRRHLRFGVGGRNAARWWHLRVEWSDVPARRP